MLNSSGCCYRLTDVFDRSLHPTVNAHPPLSTHYFSLISRIGYWGDDIGDTNLNPEFLLISDNAVRRTTPASVNVLD